MKTCEFRSACGLYNDLEARRPITLESIKEEYCDTGYSECARYMISKARGPNNVSKYLFPEDILEACRIMDEFDNLQ
jgi:hypothetical protein